ncbi:MAG: helix-turn-helix domain-containing protein [Dehalococcoidia bacterium]|nr:helix-turn-helix domain-containing protein [Dehalococcoidia bacterium]
MEVNPKKYLSIKEAAVAYRVSRTKIHRLVKSGAVRSAGDPRDDRITLVNVDDLDSRFRGDTVMDMNSAATLVGVATVDKLSRMNAIRAGGAAGGTGSDSTEILREARAGRSGELAARSGGAARSVGGDGR